ncbi:hypothetical protein KJ564_08935, partial [bacterium]|nr:hypothetical protein [bacterium]
MGRKSDFYGFIVLSLLITVCCISGTTAASTWVPLNGVQAIEEAPVVTFTGNSYQAIDLQASISGFRSETINNEAGAFNLITLRDAGVTNKVGAPQLPAIRRMIEIPFGATPELVLGRTVLSRHSLRELGLEHPLMPVQEPLEKVPGAHDRAQFSLDRSVYATDEFVIGEQVRVAESGIIGGHRFIILEIYPIDYNPASGMVHVLNDVEIQIRLNGADQGLTRQMKERYADPYISGLFKRLADSTLDEVDLIPPPLCYLIITNNYYASQTTLQDFIDWKTQKGFHVVMATTEVIGSSTNAIKTYIQTAYDTWEIAPNFVLLIGDVDVIPNWVGSGTGSPITDLYYATVAGGDSFPDIGVGRFSCTSVGQLERMVNRTLEYEQVGWVGNDDWEKHIVFMASNDNYGVSEGTHNFVIDNYLAPDGYRTDRLYCHTYSATTAQVTAAFNEGRSVGTYSGHGSTTSWADGPPFSQSNVNALVNEVYPMVHSFACVTGQFTVGECFGETWIRTTNGALAFWGSSVNSYWSEDDILEKKVYEGFFDVQWPQADQHLTWIAGMCDYGKIETWMYFGGGGMMLRYMEMYNVLGDASVDLWTDIPNQLTVNYPGAVLIGQNQIEVTVSGYPDWAMVHIYSDAEDLMFTDYVDAGSVTFDLGSGFAVPGNLEIWVTGHDCEPYNGTAQIIPPVGPYVIYNSHEVDDSVTGNNNGQLDYGETVELSITAENVGVAAAMDVNLTLTSLDPLLTIIDGTEYLGNLAPGATLSTIGGFTVEASSDLPDDYAISCQLDATDGIETWTTYFTITGHAPVAAFNSLTVHDDTGNQNGNLDPGEAADLEVELINDGSCDVDDVTFTASTTDPYVTVTSAAGTVGSLPVGGTNSGLFSVEVSSSCPQEHTVRFDLAVSGFNGYYTELEITSVVGNILYAPTGPDNYGYMAYDPFDAPETPIYDWVEICADSGGPGTLINFTLDDQTFQFDLPFDFQYYGVNYNRYSVGANGWIGMGDVFDDDYSNSGIPNGDGPERMIAPYWEDLSPQRTNSGKVWNWYDAANHRLVVEYNHIEQYTPAGSFETFQVILLDPAYYTTSTGDGRIIFQYKDMSGSHTNEGTVGIENHDETTGLQVLFDGGYDQHVHPIENGMVILFSTPVGTPSINIELTYISGSPVPAGGG